MTKTSLNIIKRLCLAYSSRESRICLNYRGISRHFHSTPRYLDSYTPTLKPENVRYNGVRIALHPEENWTNDVFEQEILKLSEVWVQDNTRSVFLEVPIHLSHVIEVASKHGFVFHHARGKQAVLCKWLVGNEENKIPLFSNHTIGVAGACYRSETDDLLVVRDKGKYSHWWKFPGGYSDVAEYIGETATREVYEETGVRSEFQSILSFRQHHGVFYGQSDLYYICRLKALTFDLVPCPQEIDECQWKSIDELLNTENATPFVKMICRLLRHGKETGFHKIDINEHDVENWARKGNRMKIFHRNLEPYH